MVIEQNLEPVPAQAGIIKTADHILDLGPGSGERGGEIVAWGTPEKVAGMEGSFTGHYVKPMLERATPQSAAKKKQPKAAE